MVEAKFLKEERKHRRRKARAFLLDNRSEAFTKEEIAEEIGVDSIPYIGSTWPSFGPFTTRKTYLDGNRYYYAKVNWWFWGAMTVVAFAAGFWIEGRIPYTGAFPVAALIVIYQHVTGGTTLGDYADEIRDGWDWLTGGGEE